MRFDQGSGRLFVRSSQLVQERGPMRERRMRAHITCVFIIIITFIIIIYLYKISNIIINMINIIINIIIIIIIIIIVIYMIINMTHTRCARSLLSLFIGTLSLSLSLSLAPTGYTGRASVWMPVQILWEIRLEPP